MNPLIISDSLVISVGSEILSVATPESTVRFRRHIGSSLTAPTSSNGSVVLVGSSQGDVFELDPERGTILWAFQGSDPVLHRFHKTVVNHVVTATSILVLT